MNPKKLTKEITPSVRMARPTASLAECEKFYVTGLGMEKLGSFRGHDGFDGDMFGLPGTDWHLEFTMSDHPTPPAPSEENLLVLYVPSADNYAQLVRRMKKCGFSPAVSLNPYWDRNGTTYMDPDGYRVVLSNQSWPPFES